MHDIRSELVDGASKNILRNEFKYQYQNDEEYFGIGALAYEDLNVADKPNMSIYFLI